MVVQNPTSCAISITGTTYTVTWVGGTGSTVNINVFQSATGGTPPSGYSVVATSNGVTASNLTANITGTPVAGYWYFVIVHTVGGTGNDLAGPTLSPAYQNGPPPVMPTFTLTSLSATRMVITWSGGSSVSSINFQTVIADATNMTGNTNFYSPGTYQAIGSGSQNIDTTYTPGYSFSATMLVTFSNSSTQSSGVLTPGIQLPSTTVVTTGGTLTTNGGQSIVTFTSSGTFKLIYPANTTMTYLVVGGGGGGGFTNCAGGGGAGGAVQASAGIQDMTLHGSYTVTVGNGGAGGSYTTPTYYPAGNGGDTTFNGTTGTGGGAGGSIADTPQYNGHTGGCGGGASYNGGIGAAGSQGFAGGNGGPLGGPNNGGGGGGMGSVGLAANYIYAGGSAGNGGDGKTYVIGGNSYTVSGGGGGGGDQGYGAGGSGIGGQGGNGSVFCTAGATNTGSGGGGGGGGQISPAGAAGGSGVVRIAYQTNVSLNPDLRPFQPRSPVGRTNYYKHTGRGMGRYMGDWMDTNIV